MPGALGSIASVLSSPVGQGIGKVAELGSAGAGLVGNILNERNRSQIQKREQGVINQLNNPQQLANEAQSTAAPLNAGLVQAVNNQVGGTLAEQGLSQSPGIVASTTAQALGPYEQQAQSQALQAIMTALQSQLSGYQGMSASLPPNVDMSKLLAMLFNQPKTNTGTPSSVIAANTPPPSTTQSTWADTSSVLVPPDAGGIGF